MKITISLLHVAMLCCFISTKAQSLNGKNLADSLLQQAPFAKHDTDKVLLYYKAARTLIQINTDTALYYTTVFDKLAAKINWQKGVGLALMNKSLISLTLSDYINSLNNAEEAYHIFSTINWKQGMANAAVEIGNNYSRLGYYSKAIEFHLKALSIYESISGKPYLGTTHNNLAISYYYLFDYNKALTHYKKALEHYTKNNDEHGVASALDNIALTYKEMGDYTNAELYNSKAITLFEKNNDDYELSLAYAIRGELMQNRNDYTTALSYYNKALDIDNRMDIKSNQANDYAGIADLYYNQSKKKLVINIPDSLRVNTAALLNKARSYYSKAFKLSEGTGELSLLMDQAKALSIVETDAGNYKAALDWYKRSMTYKDSIFNDENKNKIAALENQRLTEVKDKEIELLNKDKALQALALERQTITRNIILSAVLIIALFAFVLIRASARRKKIVFESKMLETEMKALRAQMNPHFIFNSLHSINNYMLENDKTNASDYLSRFSKLMRFTLENSREQEITLAQDLDALETYLQLETVRFQHRFTYNIIIDKNIDTDNTLVPPMLLQPFVENAIIHGLANKKDGLIKIIISQATNNSILCIVEDNGAGMQEKVTIQHTKDKKHKSLGVKITEERLTVFNQLKKSKASINVFHVLNNKNEPSGVRVELQLPLQLAF